MGNVKKHDWGLVVAGGLLLVCGAVFLFEPESSLAVFTSFAGAFFLVSGIFNIINYVRFHKTGLSSEWTIFYAILDILIGLMFLLHPVILSAIIPWIIGFFVLISAIYECIAAFTARKMGVPLWGWILFSGILSLIIALCLFFVPVSLVIYIAVFMIIRAVTLIAAGWNAQNPGWM